MDLETVTQSEVRKNKYSNNSAYTWNIEKWYNDLICKAETDTDVENKYTDTKGIKEGWDELGNWNWHTHTTMYKTDNKYEPIV